MSALTPTRPDTLGPYFPPSFAAGALLDLLRPGAPAEDAVTIDLRVLDRDGNGATNLLVEAWQPDGAGRRPGRDADADPRLASIARLLSRDGVFRLRTIRPGGDGDRAGWIALSLYSDGLERLATELFLGDDEQLERDPLRRVLPPAEWARLVAHATGTGRYAIDIRLSGAGETPFLTGRATDAAAPVQPYPGDNTSAERTPSRAPVLVPGAVAGSLLPWVEAAELPATAGPAADWVGDAADGSTARGTAIEIAGRVLDDLGQPLPGIVLELWAANASGRYRHPDDRSDPALDPGYDGFGRLRTDAAGRYRLRLIAPGAYLARPDIGRWRPGHVHVSLIGGDVRLVTQLYFPGDPHHAPDPMRIAHGAGFDRQLLQPDAARPHSYRYDFVIGR